MPRNLNDRTPDLDTLVEKLQNHGYRFTWLDVVAQDSCDLVDVEWNYKDIAHVPYVHSHMWREFTYIGSNCYSTLDRQSLFGISIPQSTTFFVTEDNRLIAQTTLFLFIILVEVRFEQTGELEVKTVTRYAVGARMWLARLLFPIIRNALRRNWERFMADDRPVRQRRGELRKKGFTFDDQSPIDMRKTIPISGIGVVPPDRDPEVSDYVLNVSENMRQTVRIGDSDHFGLQISFSPQSISIFPRLCPHRGCSLDKDDCDVKVITCPWHGREFSALCMIENNGKAQAFEGPLHRCTYDGKNVEISIRKPAATRVRSDDGRGIADWTAPWEVSRN